MNDLSNETMKVFEQKDRKESGKTAQQVADETFAGLILEEKDDEIMAESAREQSLDKELADQLVEKIVKNVPEEKQEELAEKIQKLSEEKSDEPTAQDLARAAVAQVHAGKSRTERSLLNLGAKNLTLGGESKLGITRKDKSPSKKARKASKNSRRINRGK